MVAAAVAALLPLGAGAATLISPSPFNADIVVRPMSASGLISLDFDFNNMDDTEVTLRFRIDAAEAAAGRISFNAILRNNMGFPFWEAAVWQAPGSPVTIGEPPGSVWGNSAPITYPYHGPSGSGGYFDLDHAENGAFGEPLLAYLGNPLSQSGRTDFTLMLNGLTADSEFDVIVAVPEPGELAFLLAGLGLAAARLRKGRSATR